MVGFFLRKRERERESGTRSDSGVCLGGCGEDGGDLWCQILGSDGNKVNRLCLHFLSFLLFYEIIDARWTVVVRVKNAP